MTRRELFGGLAATVVWPMSTDQTPETRTLLVDVDAVLSAARGWDIPVALKKEIDALRERIAKALQ